MKKGEDLANPHSAHSPGLFLEITLRKQHSIMSTLKYSCYDFVGVRNRQRFHYSQAVRIPAGADRIECAGQGTLVTITGSIRKLGPQSNIITPGGWNPKDGSYPSSTEEQIAQAFEKCALNLRDAGVEGGWSKVYSVRSYHVPLDEKSFSAMVEHMRKYCPDHAPIWTCIEVPALARKEMKVEIDVFAYDG